MKDRNIYKEYKYELIYKKHLKAGIIFDVMVTGGTGAGKSTTLNALFQQEVARVGNGPDPETIKLSSYKFTDIFRLWDTPGLGDNIENDKKYSREIVNLLKTKYIFNKKTYGFIDLVLVILDGSTRDMGTTYKLLNEIIFPNFPNDRVLIAINQADMAMKGRYWDYENNQPEPKLIEFLDKKVESVKKRIREATGIEIIDPVYYSARYNFNIDKLLDLLISNMPDRKRIFR